MVAIVGGTVVLGGMNERASLMASEKRDGDESSGQPESTSDGRVENLGAVNGFKAGHGGHGLGVGGQGGGCGSGRGWVTYFSGVLLPSVV